MMNENITNAINAFANGFSKTNLLLLGFSLSDVDAFLEKYKNIYAVTESKDMFLESRKRFLKNNKVTLFNGDSMRVPANNYSVMVFSEHLDETMLRRDTSVLLKKNFMNEPFILVYNGCNEEGSQVNEFVDKFFGDIKVPISNGDACVVYITPEKKEEFLKKFEQSSI